MSTITSASTAGLSSFNSGRQAIDTASNGLNRAGADIVAQTTDLQSAETGSVDESLVDLQVNETYAKSGAKVISATNNMLGSLLDITA